MRLPRYLAFLACVAAGGPAMADIYGYTDRDGVMHFTNLEPKGRDRRRWKVVHKTGPGKAAARRGADGCKGCDLVPARDTSPANTRNGAGNRPTRRTNMDTINNPSVAAEVLAALKAIVLTPHIRAYLGKCDPMVLAQAERAITLADHTA